MPSPRPMLLFLAALALNVVPAQARGAPARPEQEVQAAGRLLDKADKAMVVDPRHVFPLISDARTRLARAPRSRASEILRTRALLFEAEALGRLGELDRAKVAADAGLLAIGRLERNGRLHARLLLTRGSVALDENEAQVAFSLFRRAHDLFERLGDPRSQAVALQNIGTIYSYAGDQRSVLRYYAQAEDVFSGDPALTIAAANNLGAAYKELGQLDRADAEFRRALTLAGGMRSASLKARILTNLASVALRRDRLAEAEHEVDQGLAVARGADAAEWAPYLWGVKAQIAFRRGNVARAAALFDRTFAGEDLTATSFYFRDFHQTASEAYLAASDPARAVAHLAAFKRLDDEAREIRSTTNAALSAAQFDWSNQELRISRLRQGQLRRDLELGEARQRQQWLLLAGSLLLLAGTIVALFWINRSRNQTEVANHRLASTNEALDKALKAKSEFLATTSHELRTPLNGILGMAQVLMRRDALEPGARDQVRLIDSAGNTMKAIVDDLLDMAQIEAGRIEVDREEIAIRDLLGDIASLWRPAAESKGVTLSIDVADAPPSLIEDERKLRQIIYNLLSNAVKFTEAGEVSLRASVEPGSDSGDRLRIAIRDSGIGIAADQLELIFEPFRQADGGITRRFGGTGLGLAICAKLASALGGHVSVSSEPGVGSCFTLDLPLHPAAARGGATNAPAITLAGARVAVIEPNPLFAGMIRATLDGRTAATTVSGSLDGAPADLDILVIDGATVTAESIAAIRANWRDARLVALGDPGEGDRGLVDLVVQRMTPPLHLPAALDLLFDATPQRAAA